MKAKLTVTIDEEVIPKAKAHARARGVSLSKLIEDALRDLSDVDTSSTSFSQRWRGRFRPASRPGELFEALAKKHR